MVIRTWNNRIYIIIKFNIMIDNKSIADKVNELLDIKTSNFNSLYKLWQKLFDDYRETLKENFMLKIRIAELEANQKPTEDEKEDTTKIQNTTRLREDDSSQEVVLEK